MCKAHNFEKFPHEEEKARTVINININADRLSSIV